MKILLKLSFDGSAYCGWQSQKNGDSVQEKLNYAAERLFGKPCDITGCSRTDSGVHATWFCACVRYRGDTGIVTTVPLEAVPRAINCFLPDDISVLEAKAVPDDFHPRYDVLYKEYTYRILTRPERDAFLAGRVWHHPGRLDTGLMNEAAKHFVGTYDFTSFMAQGSKICIPVRTVRYSEVFCDGELTVFRIAADGFLYNMVRIMTGTLVRVGAHKLSPDRIPEIIKARDRSAAGMTAPACGLFLSKVIYN